MLDRFERLLNGICGRDMRRIVEVESILRRKEQQAVAWNFVGDHAARHGNPLRETRRQIDDPAAPERRDILFPLRPHDRIGVIPFVDPAPIGIPGRDDRAQGRSENGSVDEIGIGHGARTQIQGKIVGKIPRLPPAPGPTAKGARVIVVPPVPRRDRIAEVSHQLMSDIRVKTALLEKRVSSSIFGGVEHRGLFHCFAVSPL